MRTVAGTVEEARPMGYWTLCPACVGFWQMSWSTDTGGGEQEQLNVQIFDTTAARRMSFREMLYSLACAMRNNCRRMVDVKHLAAYGE